MSEGAFNWTHTNTDGTKVTAFVKPCSCGGYPIHHNVPWVNHGILLACAKCNKNAGAEQATQDFSDAAARWNALV